MRGIIRLATAATTTAAVSLGALALAGPAQAATAPAPTVSTTNDGPWLCAGAVEINYGFCLFDPLPPSLPLI